jgi:hypothetical protein
MLRQIRIIAAVGTAIALALASLAFAGQRQAEYSSYMMTQSQYAFAYYQGAARDYAYSGGVTLWNGGATFYAPSGSKVPIKDLRLDVQGPLSPAAIRYKDNSYKIDFDPNLVCPLAQFINRDVYIIYTLPVVERDADYFAKNGLVKMHGAYVAKEFATEELANFLRGVDLGTETTRLPDEYKRPIISDSNGLARGRTEAGRRETDAGTYTNADFHVNYQVFLRPDAHSPEVDIAGLPLQYIWSVGEDGKAVITDIEVYTDAEQKGDLQYKAIQLFQTAAIFRQFHRERAGNFSQFLHAACQTTVH